VTVVTDTSFVAPLVYAFMGSSRDIAIGPVAVVSLLLGTLLSDEIKDVKSPEYLRLAFTATFFAGLTQMLLGLLRYITVSLYCICKIILVFVACVTIHDVKFSGLVS
jgi:MFS superfamily sulfate permease-like transporter